MLAAHPDVEEAAVIGMPHPYTGESVKALRRARAGAALSAEDVIAHAARPLARFKCPTIGRVRRRAAALGDRQGRKGRLREGEGIAEESL